MPDLPITDVAIWFKHVSSADLRQRLMALEPEGEIMLSVDSEIGRWRRMRAGKDGRPVQAIRPVGPMKDIWNEWFRNRKGERVEVRVLPLADSFLAATSDLMPEWSSDEDERAFRDL